MNDIIYLNMVEMEHNHWWYKGRREIISKLLISYLRLKMKILDAGCGAGGTMAYLSRYGTVVGIDISEEMVEHCRKMGLPAHRASVAKLPFEDQSFDLALCLDVLEHLHDDRAALEELKRVVRPGGLLVLSVPSFSWLWGHHDDLNHHYRRYNFKELVQVLHSVGLEVERSTYFNFFLLPPVWFVRRFGRLCPFLNRNTDFQLGCGKINFLFYGLLKFESILLGYLNFPVGVSQVVLARRKEN